MSESVLPVEERAVEVASVVQRIGGALIDGLLTSMVIVVPLLLGLIRIETLQQQRISAGWAFALLVFGAVYTIAPTALWGQTAGKVAVGTRVVAEADGSLPGWRRSAIRWAVPDFLGRLPYVDHGRSNIEPTNGAVVAGTETANAVSMARSRGHRRCIPTAGSSHHIASGGVPSDYGLPGRSCRQAGAPRTAARSQPCHARGRSHPY